MSVQKNQHWVIATNNQKKWGEFQGLFQGMFGDIQLSTLADHSIESPEENGLTFVENALIKARVATEVTGLPSLADDSGLVVPAFDGAPGLYSARYAFDGATDAQNNQALIKALQEADLEFTAAYYHCTLAFLRHEKDPDPIIAQGLWYGQVKPFEVGGNGFGYDPLFFPGPDFTVSSGQMEIKEKARLSHRGIAMQQLRAGIERAMATDTFL